MGTPPQIPRGEKNEIKYYIVHNIMPAAKERRFEILN